MGKRVELEKRTFVKIEAEDYPLLYLFAFDAFSMSTSLGVSSFYPGDAGKHRKGNHFQVLSLSLRLVSCRRCLKRKSQT